MTPILFTRHGAREFILGCWYGLQAGLIILATSAILVGLIWSFNL